MNKTLLAVPLVLVLAACGSPAGGTTVTVTAPAPVTVTATPEPDTSSWLTAEPEPAFPDTGDDLIIEVAVRSVWNDLSADDRDNLCTMLDIAPGMAEDSFKEGYGEDADIAWPILVKIMEEDC